MPENATWRHTSYWRPWSCVPGWRPSPRRSPPPAPALSVDQVFDAMAIRLDGPRAAADGLASVIDWHITDLDVHHRVTVRNGVVVHGAVGRTSRPRCRRRPLCADQGGVAFRARRPHHRRPGRRRPRRPERPPGPPRPLRPRLLDSDAVNLGHSFVIIDVAVYRDGKRCDDMVTLDQASRCPTTARGSSGSASTSPPRRSSTSCGATFDLHELAVEDAIKAHQRPKLEVYGDTLFVVLKTARYVDDEEEVDFGEIPLFLGADFVVTVRHGEAALARRPRAARAASPDLLQLRPECGALRHRRPRRRRLRAGRARPREGHRRGRARGVLAASDEPASSASTS